MQEENNRKMIVLTVTATKITSRLLAKVLAGVVKGIYKKATGPRHGKQTVKQLARQNSGMKDIEITEKNIKSFERVARKYKVDFALKKDKTQDPPRWLVFFKGRDADAITAAFKEFSRKQMKREERPSLRETLQKMVEKVKNAVHDRVRNKEQGEPEL